MSYVYYIRSSATGAIKIGFSTRPLARITVLQSGSADRLSLLAVEPGDKVLESQRHAQFASLRIHGEWFSSGMDLMAHILKIAKKKAWNPQEILALANEYRQLADELEAQAKLPRVQPPPARASNRRPKTR